MKSNKTLIVSIVLLLAGIYLSTQTAGLRMTEWAILIGFIVLGLVAGTIQGYAIVRERQRKISAGQRTLYIVLTIVALIAIKGIATRSIASNLEDNGTSLYMQICFPISAMFCARGWITGRLDKNPSRGIN